MRARVDHAAGVDHINVWSSAGELRDNRQRRTGARCGRKPWNAAHGNDRELLLSTNATAAVGYAVLQRLGSRRRASASGCIHHDKEETVNMTLSIGPLVSLIAGILILIVPRLLNYIVAIYLIVIGLIGLFGVGNLHLR
jgi:hypothetical protein